MELWRLLAHNHWFTLDILGREVRLCSRCTGYLLGFYIIYFSTRLFGTPFKSYTGTLPLILGTLLLLPLSIDWLTQSWGLRESNNRIRLFTGILMGVDIYLLMKLSLTILLPFIIIFLAVTTLGLTGKTLKPGTR